MAAWKQISIAILLLAAAAFGWVRYFPGAPEILARWGIEGVEWARAAPETEAARNQEGRQGARRPATVVTSPVVAATINDKLAGIGTGRANASVSIKPYSAGRLTEVLVEPGARVDRGEVLARLDSEAEEIAVDRARRIRDMEQLR